MADFKSTKVTDTNSIWIILGSGNAKFKCIC